MKVKTLALVLAALTLWTITSQADEQISVIKVKGQVYSNATVVKVTSTDIFFISAEGTRNAKLADLDPELQKHFHYTPPEPVAIEQKSAAMKDQFFHGTVPKTFQAEQKQILAVANSKATLAVIGISFLFYLFLCYCFKRICEKCGVKPGALVWIPVFNLIRLLQAAGLSGWLFITFFIPVVNLAVILLMWAKICQTCGKSGWFVLLLFVPAVNLIFIPYLAFSGDGETVETSAPREKLVIGS